MNYRLKVWWMPEAQMEAFEIDVSSPEEARLIIDTLDRYDQFQYKNNIKSDKGIGGLIEYAGYSDEGGEVFEDWYDSEGNSFEEWCEK
jgi:hypothetical protein